jgi:hypothetical protein
MLENNDLLLDIFVIGWVILPWVLIAYILKVMFFAV